MSNVSITHKCPKCGTECHAYTITGRSWYIECKNAQCPRYMRTLEVNEWLKMTDEAAEAQTLGKGYSAEIQAIIDAARKRME